jgi:hypothetical protein
MELVFEAKELLIVIDGSWRFEDVTSCEEENHW